MNASRTDTNKKIPYHFNAHQQILTAEILKYHRTNYKQITFNTNRSVYHGPMRWNLTIERVFASFVINLLLGLQDENAVS